MQETALRDASSIQEFFKWLVLTAVDLCDGVTDLWQKFMSSIVVAAAMCSHYSMCIVVMLKLVFKLPSWQQMDGSCVRAESRSMFQKMVSLS